MKGPKYSDLLEGLKIIIEKYITRHYSSVMKRLMTRHFSKWAGKQKIPKAELTNALNEVLNDNFEASLGGHLIKKRIRFKGQGKSGGGRTIICFKKGDKAIFIHGFAKNEKSNLIPKRINRF